MKGFFPVIFILLFSSCASLLNRPYTYIKVETDLDSTVVKVPNDRTNYIAPAIVPVKRSKYDIVLELHNDTINKTVQVPSKLSPAFTVGNLFSAGLYGYLIDLTNPRRFTYPKSVYVDMVSDNIVLNNNYFEPGKGSVFLTCNLPLISQFYSYDGNSYSSQMGVWGIGSGIEYYQTPKEYFSIQFSAMLGVSEELPPDQDLYRKYQSTMAFYIGLRQNFKKQKWHFGLGPAYTSIVNKQYKQYVGTYTKQIYQGIGFSLTSSRQLTKHAYVGVVYTPLVFTRNRFYTIGYQHSISLDFSLKFRVGEI